MITKRVNRYINLAVRESFKSTFGRISIGAVIVDGNYVVSRGTNSLRSHPRQARLNDLAHRTAPRSCTHAEVSALVNSKQYDLQGCSIFVGRVGRSGGYANCKPCAACQRGITDSGISRVYFTDENGVNSYEC